MFMSKAARSALRERVWVGTYRRPMPKKKSIGTHARRVGIYTTEDEIDFIVEQHRKGNARVLRTMLAWVDSRRWDLKVDPERVRAMLIAAIDAI